MAEIVYSFNLTWLMSLHYLVRGGCSKFLPNTGFVTIRLLRFDVKQSKWRGHTVATTFLLRGHCQTCRTAHRRISTRHRRFPGAREMRETRHRLGAFFPFSRGTFYFEHELWQFWADLSRQLITLLNKPYLVYCVLIQSLDTLVQIIHFNVM